LAIGPETEVVTRFARLRCTPCGLSRPLLAQIPPKRGQHDDPIVQAINAWAGRLPLGARARRFTRFRELN
jgi:hypothetical protein